MPARTLLKADQLAPLGDLDQPCQGLQGAWATRWPALADVPWLLPVGDGAAANIGAGCDTPDRVALTMGTTGAMRVVVGPELARVPDGLWLYRVDGPRALLGGATTEGGNLYAWLRTLLQLPDEATLQAALAERPAAGHGLMVLRLNALRTVTLGFLLPNQFGEKIGYTASSLNQSLLI